ncbi:MAG: hypothetical protein ACXIUD_04420 [Mongoliitalea sp.]
MNIEARKIKFIQEFLQLEDEDSISKLESLLSLEKLESGKSNLNPFDKEELYKRIERSEEDFEKGRFKSSEELLLKYQNTKI